MSSTDSTDKSVCATLAAVTCRSLETGRSDVAQTRVSVPHWPPLLAGVWKQAEAMWHRHSCLCICRDSGNKTVARGASAFCEHPWLRILWISCRVSGTESRRNRHSSHSSSAANAAQFQSHRSQRCSQKALAALATLFVCRYRGVVNVQIPVRRRGRHFLRSVTNGECRRTVGSCVDR